MIADGSKEKDWRGSLSTSELKLPLDTIQAANLHLTERNVPIVYLCLNLVRETSTPVLAIVSTKCGVAVGLRLNR